MASIGDGDDAGAADHGELCCYLYRCFCRWRRLCAPNIPRVSPGGEYVCVPAGADDRDRPTWSVLVGCTNFDDASHTLRLHRFRVTGSGRVLGRSDDLLEHFRTVSPDDGERTVYTSAEAALAPDGRRLHIVCAHWPAFGSTSPSSTQEVADERLLRKVFSMDLADKSLSPPLPHLPFSDGSYRAVSAQGGFSVPAVRQEILPAGRCGFTWRLFVYRPFDDNGYWAEVTNVEFLYDHTLQHEPRYQGPLLQGYAFIRLGSSIPPSVSFLVLPFDFGGMDLYDLHQKQLLCFAADPINPTTIFALARQAASIGLSRWSDCRRPQATSSSPRAVVRATRPVSLLGPASVPRRPLPCMASRRALSRPSRRLSSCSRLERRTSQAATRHEARSYLAGKGCRGAAHEESRSLRTLLRLLR